MSDADTPIEIPESLLPGDGRFGSGPSKVRSEAVAALADEAPTLLGTSHRQPRVRDIVGRLRTGVSQLFGLPDDWEVVLGNGGATGFWDAASFGLIDQRSQHLVFGEFSGKFAKAVAAAPHLGDPTIIEAEPGTAAVAVAEAGIDTYALIHNETSTGVVANLTRPADEGIVIVDATSAAGGIDWDHRDVDVYYFSLQKSFAADGGLFIAACSPAAIERMERLTDGSRWTPPTLDLGVALANSRQNQTYNTPALATIFLGMHQIEWMVANGGIAFSAGRSAKSASVLYDWAERTAWATPFVTDPALRSPVVGTIDFDDHIDATTVSKVLRANGIVDTEGYRKLGRNQVRIGMFPAIEPDDVQALTECIEFIAERLG